MIIAVDFDGTLQFADGQANFSLFSLLLKRQRQGDSIILWTCRSGKSLLDAVQFCAEHGLRFNAVNENLLQTIRMQGHNPRKIYADLYIDDKALRVDAGGGA